jgi:hypothetical protein
MRFIWYSVWTAVIFLNGVNQLMFVTQNRRVFFAVRTEFLKYYSGGIHSASMCNACYISCGELRLSFYEFLWLACCLHNSVIEVVCKKCIVYIGLEELSGHGDWPISAKGWGGELQTRQSQQQRAHVTASERTACSVVRKRTRGPACILERSGGERPSCVIRHRKYGYAGYGIETQMSVSVLVHLSNCKYAET